jgi:hypothetical protein
VKQLNPQTTLETLIPDFKGDWNNLQRIIDVAPEVVSHNLETVERLTKKVRIQAKYHRSLEVLRRLKEGGIAVHINGVRVAYWLQHSKNRPKLSDNDNGQWECCCGDKITYEDYTNGYKITEYLEGANKGKFEVHYMNKQRGIGCGNIVAFKNYTFRNE